jgi:predicted phage terminase large subunit-like protein
MGLLPPGAGKSVYTSVVFPTHFLGRFPSKSVILTSYGKDLPNKFGRRARSIVSSRQFRRIFDATLSPESGAVDEWALTNGSEWMAAGILMGITGNRADGVIWDDLIKGREQADSDVIRQKTWDAYMEDLMTRKKPKAWEVGVTTRWHEDDVAGRILPDNYDGESGWVHCRDGNDWYVVCLPAECDRADDLLGRKIGEILWPEWFTPAHFAPFKKQARTWSALFQQRPAPDAGDFFQAEWLKSYGFDQKQQLPPREALNVYGASDYAVTANGGDYTVHIVVGVDSQQRIFVLDLWRAQTTSAQWIDAFCDLVLKWRPLGWAEETGQIKAAVGPFLTQRMRERHAYVVRASFPTRGDKRTRAQSIRGRMEMDGLYVPIHASWYPAFRKEILTFDAGRNDDQVDALGLIGQVLDKMIRGKQVVVELAKPKVLSTDPRSCTVTLDDLFSANEHKRSKYSVPRIH